MSTLPPRPAFKPSRPRASLSALPSTSVALAADGENTAPGPDAVPRADASTRRKRAQSLGGAALDDARKKARRSSMAPTATGGELSPGKLARRKLVPRRSILKAKPAVFDEPTGTIAYELGSHTTNLEALSTVPFAKKRRQSLAPPTGTLADQMQEGESETESESDDGEMDMDMTGVTMNEDRRKSLARRVSFAPNAHIRTFTPDKPTAQAQLLLQQQQQQLYLEQQRQDDSSSVPSSDEPDRSGESMEMATDVTHAFAGHFAGTVPVSVYKQQDDDSSEGEDMEEATGDVTGAFAVQPTVLHNSQAASSSQAHAQDLPQESVRHEKGKARFSEAVSEVDVQDNYAPLATMGLGLPSGKPKPRFSEVVRNEDAEDNELLRQLGLQKGRAPAASVSFAGPSSSDDDDDDESEAGDEVTMDMTVAVGKVLSQQLAEEEGDDDGNATVDMSFATVAGADRTMDLDEDEDEGATGTMQDDNRTSSMVEATTHGGILASTSLAAPAPSLAAPSMPSARLQAQIFSRQSMGTVLPISPRPNSPRRVVAPTQSPTKPLPSPRRVASPTKLAPGSPVTPRRAGRASTSPVKKPATPNFGAPPGGLTNSARRTPGGSLSLKGLMEEQRKLALATATATESPKAPIQRRWDSPRGVGASRVDEMRAAQGAEDDSTGSSFGLYGDEDNLPQITSLDAFFQATEMHFHKDISGFAGVEFANKSRKSMVPQEDGREPSGPPSFADHIVAGACKALFHSLYRSDQVRLSEDIEQTIQSLASFDEALPHDQPTVFKEWLSASEAHRTIMLNQFRMIKTHYFLSGRIDWMTYRSQNIAQIVEVMVDNLEGLRADNAMVEAAAFDQVIPDLEARHAAFMKELEEERVRDHELESCDQEDLAQLQEAIVEQTEQLKLHERQSAEAQGHLADLNAKATDLEQQELASAKENDELRGMLELGRVSTQAEVSRLFAEYQALQKVHGWKLVNFTRDSACLSHLDAFELRLQLANGRVTAATFTPLVQAPSTHVLSRELTRFLLTKVNEHVRWVLDPSSAGQNRSAKALITRISSLWTCARRLRREITITNHRFPTSAALLSSGALRIAVEIHVPKQRATFGVVFELTGDELVSDEERRPAEVDRVLSHVASDVLVKFGKVDSESLKYIVRERLDAGGRGALLEACNEAEAKYL